MARIRAHKLQSKALYQLDHSPQSSQQNLLRQQFHFHFGLERKTTQVGSNLELLGTPRSYYQHLVNLDTTFFRKYDGLDFVKS